ADYSGDGSFTTSTSVLLRKGGQTASTRERRSGVCPSALGQSVTFTATVAATATGTVTFKDAGVALTGGTVALNASGVATYTTTTLTSGAHAITADYSGDGSFTTSTSAPLTQRLEKRCVRKLRCSATQPTPGEKVSRTAK